MQRSERRRKKRQRELERQQRRREKEVQRYQKKRNRYGEEKVIRHAKHGVRSTLIAIAAIVLLSLLVTVSYYVQEGKAATMIGALGICAWILSGVGIFFGMIGLRERERKYLTCRIGIVCNAALFVGLAIIFFRGI